uniref:Uncharacterized protein n=1 Tax=Oryza punctata TaxID=4537 RepID=A0A0E0JN18_ORYPU
MLFLKFKSGQYIIRLLFLTVSPSQKPIGIETNVPSIVEDNPLPAIPHVPSGKRKPTTSPNRGDPETAKSSTTVKVECKVLLHVKAELDACKERDIQLTSPYKEPQDHVITFIDKSSRKLFVPHHLDNMESSGSNFSREVNVINNAVEEVRENGEVHSDDLVDPTRADDSTRTPAQHLNVIGSLLRQTTFNPVTFPEG